MSLAEELRTLAGYLARASEDTGDEGLAAHARKCEEMAASAAAGAKLMTIREFAAWTSIDESTVRRNIKNGRIPYQKIGGAVRIDPKHFT